MSAVAEVKLKWVMDSYTHFHAVHEELRIVIQETRWFILKGDEIIDCFAYHRSPATSSELSAKVDATRYLNQHLKK